MNTALFPKLAVAAIAAAVLTGCTTDDAYMAQQGEGLACLRPAQISGWRLIDDETVLVHAGVNDYYQLDLAAPCPQFDWTRSLGFETLGRVHRSGIICPSTAEQLNVVMPVGNNVLRCPVRDLRLMTPDEIAALPPPLRP